MAKIITILCYINAFVLLNMSADYVYIGTGLNPWIGLPLCFIFVAIAYTIMFKEFSKPSYRWKAKDFIRK